MSKQHNKQGRIHPAVPPKKLTTMGRSPPPQRHHQRATLQMYKVAIRRALKKWPLLYPICDEGFVQTKQGLAHETHWLQPAFCTCYKAPTTEEPSTPNNSLSQQNSMKACSLIYSGTHLDARASLSRSHQPGLRSGAYSAIQL